MIALLTAENRKGANVMLPWKKSTVAWYACTIAYVVLVALLVLDLFYGGGVGTFSATLLYCSVVACIQFLIASFIGDRYLQVSKCIWLGLAISAFALAIHIYFQQPGAPNLNNADTVLYFTMMVLSFPLGLVGLGVFLALGNSIFEVSPMLYLFSIWLTLFVLGLAQWLWIFPRLIARIKRKAGVQSIVQG